MSKSIGNKRIAIVHQAGAVVAAYDEGSPDEVRKEMEKLGEMLDAYDDTQVARNERRLANKGPAYREGPT